MARMDIVDTLKQERKTLTEHIAKIDRALAALGESDPAAKSTLPRNAAARKTKAGARKKAKVAAGMTEQVVVNLLRKSPMTRDEIIEQMRADNINLGPRSMSKRIVGLKLHHLNQRGVIAQRGDKFVVADDYVAPENDPHNQDDDPNNQPEAEAAYQTANAGNSEK